jgi:hypothetical protein
MVMEILLSSAWHGHENFVRNLTQIIPHIINLHDVATCLGIEDRQNQFILADGWSGIGIRGWLHCMLKSAAI